MLKKDIPCLGVYLICINKNSRNLIEIYHSIEITKPFYSNKELLVIGISQDGIDRKESAANILGEYYARHNCFDDFKTNMIDR